MLWIAHRGESAEAPENTLAAFRLAWERGVRAVELDVHLSADGEVMVCHDADTQRTAGVRYVIAETPASVLRELDVGSWKSPRFAGERMPTLGEVLAELPAKYQAVVEIKSGVETVAPVATLVRERRRAADVTVISFHPDIVAAAKKTLPECTVLWLVDADDPMPDVEKLIREAKTLGADGLNLCEQFRIDADFVRAVRSAGLMLYVWTVNEVAPARTLRALEIDGITSDRASMLRDRLRH